MNHSSNDAKPPVLPAPPASPLARQVSAGLAKLGMALKTKAWREGSPRHLTPAQAQVLLLLQGNHGPMRLSEIAERLAVTLPTASDTVATLVSKELVIKERSTQDARAVAISLTTAGSHEAWRVAQWPDFLNQAVGVLVAEERAVFMKALVKMVHTLQERGEIPVARMCVTCTHFRPHVYPDDPERPHHCMFVDAPFGDRSLRIECADHRPASAPMAEASWRRFLGEEQTEESDPASQAPTSEPSSSE